MSEPTKFDPEKVTELPPYVSSESNQIIRAISRIDYDALLALHEVVQADLAAMTEDRNLWKGDHNEDCPNEIRANTAESQLRELRGIVKEYRQGHEDYLDSDFSLSCLLATEGKDNRCPTCIKADLFLEKAEGNHER